MAYTPPPAVAPITIMREDFRRLDESKWFVADGWSDGDWMLNDWRRSQVRTGIGGLTLTLVPNPSAKAGYSSGELQSRRMWSYGYYEAKLVAARGPGLDTGFYLYTGAIDGQRWNEVDVELLGKDTRSVQVTYHVGSAAASATVALPFDAAAEPHAFGFDWQPDHIRWYVDGRLVHEETGSRVPLPTERQKIFFNVWGSASKPDWLGRFVGDGTPRTARVTCFAVSASFQSQLC